MSTSLPRRIDSPFWPPNWNQHECWVECYTAVIGYACNLMDGDLYLAQDAVQNAARAFWLGYKNLIGCPRAWFFGVVRNQCIEILRKRNRKSVTLVFPTPSTSGDGEKTSAHPIDSAICAAATPDQSADNPLMHDLLQRMIASLSEKDRNYFVSFYQDKLSHDEIAARHKMTSNAVKCALRRIRITLRNQFVEELTAFGIAKL